MEGCWIFLLVALILLVVALILYWSKTPAPPNLPIIVGGMRNPMIFNTTTLNDLGPQLKSNILKSSKVVTVAPPTALPASFDARTEWPGKISPALNQGSCGACWGYSSVTTISDRFRIKYNVLMNKVIIPERDFQSHALIPGTDQIQQLNRISITEACSCRMCGEATTKCELQQNQQPVCPQIAAVGLNQNCNNQVCSGGVVRCIYYYMADVGGPAASCPSRTGRYICSSSEETGCPHFKIQCGSIVNLRSVDAIKQELMTNGPVTATYTVYSDFETFFVSNPKAVYTTPRGGAVGGHGIVIVGWEAASGSNPECWVIRNSWGPTWGDEGFFRMQLGKDLCGIEDDVWAAMPDTPPTGS